MATRRLVFPILLAWVVAILGGCAPRLHVERVIDGDTFELSDGSRIRLIGVDAPEQHDSEKLRRDAERTGRDVEAIRALGRAAGKYTSGLVAGKRVRLVYDAANAFRDHLDAYGRTLAYVWVVDEEGDRVFRVNDRLIRDGYAYAYTQYPFKHREKYLQLERDARRHRRGLWKRGLMPEEEARGRLLEPVSQLSAHRRALDRARPRLYDADRTNACLLTGIPSL